MQKPSLSRNLRSQVLGGAPGLLAAIKHEKIAGTIYCSEDLRPHRGPRDSGHGASDTERDSGHGASNTGTQCMVPQTQGLSAWCLRHRDSVHGASDAGTQCMVPQTPSVGHFKHFFTLLWRIFFFISLRVLRRLAFG